MTRYQYVWGPASDKSTIEYLLKLAERTGAGRDEVLRRVRSAFEDYRGGLPRLVCRTELEDKVVFTLFLGDAMRQFNLTKETLENLTPRVINIMSSPPPYY